jgi:hypothetical protein
VFLKEIKMKTKLNIVEKKMKNGIFSTITEQDCLPQLDRLLFNLLVITSIKLSE